MASIFLVISETEHENVTGVFGAFLLLPDAERAALELNTRGNLRADTQATVLEVPMGLRQERWPDGMVYASAW